MAFITTMSFFMLAFSTMPVFRMECFHKFFALPFLIWRFYDIIFDSIVFSIAIFTVVFVTFFMMAILRLPIYDGGFYNDVFMFNFLFGHFYDFFHHDALLQCGFLLWRFLIIPFSEIPSVTLAILRNSGVGTGSIQLFCNFLLMLCSETLSEIQAIFIKLC